MNILLLLCTSFSRTFHHIFESFFGFLLFSWFGFPWTLWFITTIWFCWFLNAFNAFNTFGWFITDIWFIKTFVLSLSHWSFSKRLIFNWLELLWSIKSFFIFFWSWDDSNWLVWFKLWSRWFIVTWLWTLRFCGGLSLVCLRSRLLLHLSHVYLRFHWFWFLTIRTKSLVRVCWLSSQILNDRTLCCILILLPFGIEVFKHRIIWIWASNIINHIRHKVISIIFFHILPLHML